MKSESEYALTIAESLDDISEEDWQRLAGGNPFVGYRFLRLLQTCGCANAATGWHPRFMLLHRERDLVAAAPCYLKTHSRGEFVFDQSWAQAFSENGLDYYPKLLIAAPFTPVQGPRLLARDDASRLAIAQAVRQLCQAFEASSAHVLFVEERDRAAFAQAGFMERESVQFHWRNEGYQTTEDFLASLSQEKRKKIRQDSRYVAEAGITYEWLEGGGISEKHLEFFYQCYSNTYREHGSMPYLSLEFFSRAHAERALNLVLVVASRGSRPIACALNVKGPDALYGRYWGAVEFARGLHFETCYMQSIAYCIENRVPIFEGGAQGEHKMSRGLMPVKTYSAHYVTDRRFAGAISNFLMRETVALNSYVDDLERATPFKA